MSDLIRRQDAIDLWDKYHSCIATEAMAYDRELRALPSVQPEIVWCKDCKHRFVDGENVRFNCCELNHNKVQSDDWFCADGERKDDEQIR